MDKIINKIVESVSDSILQKLKESLDCIKSAKSEEYESEVLCIPDVCKRLKISKSTLWRHIKRGYLTPSYHVGRSPRFTQGAINEYLNKFNHVKNN